MFHRQQCVGHGGLVLEHVQSRPLDNALLQCLDQRRLVHHAATRHIDQGPLGTQRLQYPGINQMMRARSAGRDHNQEVRPCSEFGQFRVISVRHV